jgi:hypothetical protein
MQTRLSHTRPWLIKHYIKFDDIVAKVIQGLKEVGIDLA